MSTTTIRLPDEAELEERRLAFTDEADSRMTKIISSGETVGWS